MYIKRKITPKLNTESTINDFQDLKLKKKNHNAKIILLYIFIATFNILPTNLHGPISGIGLAQDHLTGINLVKES